MSTANNVSPGRVQDLVAGYVSRHPEHREAFLDDPRQALSRFMGLTIDTLEIKAVEDTADTVHVVVPADPAELGDADLDRVAGGTAGSLTAARGRTYSYVGSIKSTENEDTWSTQV